MVARFVLRSAKAFGAAVGTGYATFQGAYSSGATLKVALGAGVAAALGGFALVWLVPNKT